VALRHNLCPNPALSIDATGWGGGSAPTRTAVTGFVRDWAARYSPSGSFQETPRSAVTAGQIYTLSLYARLTSAFATSSCNSYIGWYNAGGGAISFPAQALPDLQNGVITRLIRTDVAPVGAAFASLVFDNIGGTNIDYTAMLVELDSSAQPYADGDSASWQWDGTPGLSPSSELQVSTGLVGRIAGPSSASGSVVAASARSLVGRIE
jgi:hypothetical protein